MHSSRQANRIGDTELVAVAHEAFSRIVATLPERQTRHALHAIIRSFETGPEHDSPAVDPAQIRLACWEEGALEIDYTDLSGAVTHRRIWPLGIAYSQRTLMLLAHCRLRMDYRRFHINRMGNL